MLVEEDEESLEPMLEPELPECDGLLEDEPEEDGLDEDDPEPLGLEALEPLLAQSIVELFFAVVPGVLGAQSVEELPSVDEPLDDDGLELELELEPEPGVEVLLPPEPIVLEPEELPAEGEELPVEGEAAVAPVRLCWLSLELVLPAAYASDATPMRRAAAKLVSVNFRIKTSSDRLDAPLEARRMRHKRAPAVVVSLTFR